MNNEQIIKLLTFVLVTIGVTAPLVAILSFYIGKIPEQWMWDTIGYGGLSILFAIFLNTLIDKNE